MVDTVSIISSEKIIFEDFIVNDFYDTAFSFGLNYAYLYFKENSTGVDTFYEMFKDEHYVKCNDEPYVIYHCFAGDNPAGLITKGENILEQIGEAVKQLNILHGDKNVELIEKWYYDVTQDCCNYEQDYWYAGEI
jgi:hypothetical protein